MTAPADDCGVTGGCQTCPLFAANVCGDPAPGPSEVAATFGAFGEAHFLVTDFAGKPVDDSGTVEAHLDGLDCGRRPCETCASAPTPVCVQTPSGRVRCGSTELETAPDRDPAEPRPDGVGCCGGSCSA